MKHWPGCMPTELAEAGIIYTKPNNMSMQKSNDKSATISSGGRI